MKIKAIVVHKAEAWNTTEGSLLLLFKDWGTKVWLNPEQVENYKEVNHFDNSEFQEFEVSEAVYESIQYYIRKKRLELLEYKKKNTRKK